MRERLIRLASELMNLPTVSYREEPVREYIRAFCADRNIPVREDGMGNIVATYGAGYGGIVLAFCAHMDHPGFIVEKDSRRGRTSAVSHVSVRPECFRKTGVMVFTSAGPVRGRITGVEDRGGVRRVLLRVERPVKRGDAAMWDLVAFRMRGDRLYSRSCDDTVGCVSVLALLDELARAGMRRKVMGVFTVAEECGLHGAKYVCARKRIPPNTRIISVETSKELSNARIGDGVVIRVGDYGNIFNPGMTMFMVRVAADMRNRDSGFKFQRKLMDGGCCEGAIYQEFGYRTGAVCVPLGNYHNRHDTKKAVAAEYVSISDTEDMVKLFVEMARRSNELPKLSRQGRPRYSVKKGPLGELWLN